MLRSTLSKIESIATTELLESIDIEEFRNLFLSYKKDMWLYPGVLIRKLKVSPKLVYEFLIELEKIGILKCYYELYCWQCQKSMGTVETFNEIQETFVCDDCDRELNGIENVYVIYKVICDE